MTGGDERATDRAEEVHTDGFALVGNEVRAEILRALGDAWGESHTSQRLSFEALRDRTDVDIGSSRFNYHLQQLVGHFLTKDEAGYRLRAEGRLIYQTLRAEPFRPRDSVAPVDAEFDCYYCGAPVEAFVTEGAVSVRCPGCDFVYGLSGIPPGAVDGGSLDLDQVAASYHHHHLAFARGVCSTCGAEPGTEFTSVEGLPFADPERQEVLIYRACPNCGDQRHLTLGTALLADHELLRFCFEHGVQVLSTPLWELEFAATDRGVTVLRSDPWEVQLEITAGSDTLETVVDGELNVIGRARS